MAASSSQTRLSTEQWGPEARRDELMHVIESSVLSLLQITSSKTPSCVKFVAETATEDGAHREGVDEIQFLLMLGGQHHIGRKRRLAPARLCRIVAAVDTIHSLLCSGRHCTPRELFYSHAALFGTQQRSNDIVKDLCHALKVPRHYLRLVGTAKGLVRGHVRLLEPCSEGVAWVDCYSSLEPRGHIISPTFAHSLRAESSARVVIVVEKETVFQRLLSEGFLESHRPCILVTARGFPDVPTRYLLRRIHEDCAAPRVYLLMDFDAFGLSIATTYAFGPEEAWMQDDLQMPASIPILCTDPSVAASRFGLRADDTMQLTTRDRAVATGLLHRFVKLQEQFGEDVLQPWIKSAQKLVETNKKWELDALEKLSDFIDAGMQGDL